jgi:hypothetical protein
VTTKDPSTSTAGDPALPAAVRAEDLVTQLVGRSGVTARWPEDSTVGGPKVFLGDGLVEV